MTHRREPPVDTRLPWLLLANAARARLFERDPDNGALRELADFVHPASRSKGSALGHDRAGRGSKGLASTSFEPPTSLAEREQAHFAQQLAQHLEEAARAGRVPGWALIASNPFLGRLRAALGSAALGLLRAHVDRDLSAWQGRELEQRVTAALAPQPEAERR